MGWLFAFVLIAVIYFAIPKKQTSRTVSNDAQIPESDLKPKYIFDPSFSSTQILKAMLFISKADGQTREDELMVMVDFLKRNQPEHKQSADWYLAENIKALKPFTAEEYKGFLSELNKDYLVNFQTWVKSIIGTQRKNHPYEDILLEELQHLIKSK